MRMFASALILYGFFCLSVQAQSQTSGIVYFVRGILGVFSRGLDQMGKQLDSQGVNAKVINHPAWKKAAVEIFNHHKIHKGDPIILVGHSWGANAILRIAKFLQQRKVKVQYFVTFEPNVSLPVPSNVEAGVNYYLSNSLLGQKLEQEAGSTGVFNNIDLISLDGIGHFNIEKQTMVQKLVIRNILSHLD